MICIVALSAALAAEPAPIWRTGLTPAAPQTESVTLRESAVIADATMWAFTDVETELPLRALNGRPLGWGVSFALRSTTTWAVADERATFIMRQASIGLGHWWSGRRERTVHGLGAVVDWPLANARAWALSESEAAGRLALVYVGNIETSPLDFAYDVQVGFDSGSILMARADLVVIAPLSDRWALAVGARGEGKQESVWIAMAGIRHRPSERIELALSAECVGAAYASHVRIVPDASGTFRF